MDDERRDILSGRADEVRVMQLAIGLELASYRPGTEEYEYAARRGFARQLAAVLTHTISSALIHKQLLSREELPHTRAFASELGKMRLGTDFESIHEIDRALHKAIDATMRVVLLWVALSEKAHAQEYREKREVEAAREREEKLMRRRIARAEKAITAKPVKVVKRKKQKVESKPMCEKCHKRPIVKDSLCQSCLTWEQNKLGRA